MSSPASDAAREVLAVIPLIMHTIRAEMRGYRMQGLSVPQFRALAFVRRYPGASLSAAAEHIGVTLPSMSRLIEGLVRRKLVTRRGHPGDRRRVALELTSRGRALWQVTCDLTQASMTKKLSDLNGRQSATVVRSMRTLRQTFAQGSEGDGSGESWAESRA